MGYGEECNEIGVVRTDGWWKAGGPVEFRKIIRYLPFLEILGLGYKERVEMNTE